MKSEQQPNEELSKEVFFAWSRSGIEPKRWVTALESFYADLAAEYRQLQMHKEAELFTDIVEEFERIKQKIGGTNGVNGSHRHQS